MTEALLTAATDAMLNVQEPKEFTLAGHVIKLQPLKLKTQRRIAQIAGKMVSEIGPLAEGEYGSIAAAIGKALEDADKALDVVALILQDGGVDITLEELEDQRIKTSELLAFTRAVLLANDEWGRPVVDFFAKLSAAGLQMAQAIQSADGAQIVNSLGGTSLHGQQKSLDTPSNTLET